MVRTTTIFRDDPLRMKDFFSGKIISANAAGITMIFLNDFQVNEDPVNTRGDKYDGKPKTIMLNELCSGKYLVRSHIVHSLLP